MPKMDFSNRWLALLQAVIWGSRTLPYCEYDL